MKIFDVHMHIGDKHEWTEEAFLPAKDAGR
ncbi:hypothetical protein EDC39_12014 [Geothermobacter ehrlichii]|uniref:Uncharacterized protein n=1 Tax=Geothermobacter ehrlichii TaxID=213224 RepID=A0A5D3WGW5_9BACT|nr:hypothetical protein EDC39_12014 [Geothermobacter ehrlichii]